MMAQAFPPGMAPGHPGMGGHGHPMAGMQHAGGSHMGGPGDPGGPGMMQGMHPGVSGPQVTQGPMVTGMPPGPGTPAPGGPMQNPMAMAHLGPQQHMFQQQANPQMFNNMPMTQQQQAIVRQQMMARYQQQQQQQGGMPMGMPNGMPFNAAQMAQMKMNMPIQQQMQLQAQQNAQQNMAVQAQHHQQQQLLQAQARQQAVLQAQNQQRQASQAQQMQMSRSQEHPTSQPPQPHPTPAPQNQPQPQAQPTPQTQPPTSQPTKAPVLPPTSSNQQQNQPTAQVKQGENEDEPQIKQQDAANAMIMQDIPKEQIFQNQRENAILRLIVFQDALANPTRPQDLDYWEAVVAKYFSPFGILRHQFVMAETGVDKSFGLQYPSLARYLHAHFMNGIKQILLQSYEHMHSNKATGETSVTSPNASLTYIFHNDVRVSTQGSLMVLFDEMSRITRLDIAAGGWMEYLPRSVLIPTSPDQIKDGKSKAAKKNQVQQNAHQAPHMAPLRVVGPYGVPNKIIGWLEMAEIMTQMAPLMEYYHSHQGIAPREAMLRLNHENNQQFANVNQAARLQNQMARQANGQIAFPPGMSGPNQFASPGMAHLGLPQGQGSPHIGGPVHTPSPAQNAAGGVAMMHQMSAQGSNLSGSQGASTNTSPNVSNKRRRASQIKLEEENANQGSDTGNKVKPSPRIPKRQKGS